MDDAWGGDACVALAGGGTHAQEQDEGDASVPSLHPLHSRPYGNHHPSSFISSFFLDLTPLRLPFLQVNRTRIGLQGHRRAGITANITTSSTARNILFLHVHLGEIAVDRARIGGCLHVEG